MQRVKRCMESPVGHGFDVILVQLLAVGGREERVRVSSSTPCRILAIAHTHKMPQVRTFDNKLAPQHGLALMRGDLDEKFLALL